MSITPEQLDEIERLAEAATPGPYQVASVYPAYGVFRVEVDEPSECIAMCAVSVNEDADEPHVERQEAHARNGANARAIAVLLKRALPLVKALREAWAERDEARAAATRQTERLMQEEELSDHLHKEHNKARAEVERLKAALRLLWEEATDEERCANERAPGCYSHAFSQPCRDAVEAALKEGE